MIRMRHMNIAKPSEPNSTTLQDHAQLTLLHRCTTSITSHSDTPHSLTRSTLATVLLHKDQTHRQRHTRHVAYIVRMFVAAAFYPRGSEVTNCAMLLSETATAVFPGLRGKALCRMSPSDAPHPGHRGHDASIACSKHSPGYARPVP